MAKQKRAKNKSVTNAHSGQIEDSPEVKSFIYQQINEFNPFVTPDTVIMVISRDPQKKDELEEEAFENLDYKHRIAIVLQEHEASIEAEACHDDIYEAIKLAKSSLLDRLIEIQAEIEEGKELENDLDLENNMHQKQIEQIH